MADHTPKTSHIFSSPRSSGSAYRRLLIAILAQSTPLSLRHAVHEPVWVSDTRQQIYQEADMLGLCLEVQKFISVCENIQTLLMEGKTLTSDEKGVIEFAARDLLTTLEPPVHPPSDS